MVWSIPRQGHLRRKPASVFKRDTSKQICSPSRFKEGCEFSIPQQSWRINLRLPYIFVFALSALCCTANAFGELQGYHLRGCAIEEVPYTYRDENRRSGFAGVAITYLDRLHDNLQFSFDLTEWNGTSGTLVRHMAECNPSPGFNDSCECDIAVGPFSMTNKRVKLVNFVWPFGSEDYHFVTRKSELIVDDSKNTWFVFKTFTGDVWILIGAGIFLHAVGTVLFGPFRPSQQNEKNQERISETSRFSWLMKRFPAAVLYSYGHLIGNPFIGDGGQRTPSFHRTAWVLLGLTAGFFLMTIYQASLTVLLFESEKASPLQTFEDLIGCAVSPEKIAMIAGAPAQEFWNFAVNTSVNREKCRWTKAGFTVQDLEEGFTFLREEKADYFFELEGSVLFRAHQNCDIFEPVGESFFSTSVGFFLPKRTNANQTFLLETLSEETRILRERNEYPSAKVVASRNECSPFVDASISAGKIWGFLSLYLVFWAILLVYRALFLWRRKQHPAYLYQDDDLGERREPEIMADDAGPTTAYTKQ